MPEGLLDFQGGQATLFCQPILDPRPNGAREKTNEKMGFWHQE